MKLLLSISLFLAAVIDTHAGVSENFGNCLKFFYKGQIPSGFQGIAKPDLFDHKDLPEGIKVYELASPAYICQTFENTSWFATLYDRGRLMPLYSAYILDIKKDETSKQCARLKAFKLEPQLAYRRVSANMMLRNDARNELSAYNKDHEIDERKKKNQPAYLLSTSQASDDDYKKIGYDRGHLNPCGHQSARQDGYKATFTLTNIVPMAKKLNEETWSQYETDMIKMTAQCTHTYVITGTVPVNVPIPGSRLFPPAYVWNAYCCVDNDMRPIMSGAGLAENKDQSRIKPYKGLGEFQSELQRLLGVFYPIELFQGGCKPQNV